MGHKNSHDVIAPSNLAAAVVSPVPPAEQIRVAIGAVRGGESQSRLFLNSNGGQVVEVQVERHGDSITLHRSGGKSSTFQVGVRALSVSEQKRFESETTSVIARFLKDELGIN